MTRITMPRRNLLATGACALVGAVTLPGLARASELGRLDLTNEEIIRSKHNIELPPQSIVCGRRDSHRRRTRHFS